ncbi:hypothetical protein ONO57_25730, partial [Salmonella enterica subsp. enterica serovar Anatum]|nr:hypothetical protein [Salmonella enterica subsp. enterica serovar Anatum]
AITAYFGPQLQERIQQNIIREYLGEQPVGTAFVIETGNSKYPVEFKFGKSRYSHVLPLCGALIIDVTAAIFICLYGYPFSGIVF